MKKNWGLIDKKIVLLLNRGKSVMEIANELNVSSSYVDAVRRERDAAEIRYWLKFGDTPKEIIAAGYKQQQLAAIVGADRRRASQAQLG